MRNFFLNYLGFNLREEELRDIPSPYVELSTQKAIQNSVVLGLAGTVMAGPLAATLLNSAHFTGIKQSMTKCGKWGVLIGVATAPLIVLANSKGVDEETLKDRCYRLRRHRVAIAADRFYFAGAVVGMGVSTAFGQGVVFGGLLGMSLGKVFGYGYGLIDYEYKHSLKYKQMAGDDETQIPQGR